MTDDKFEQDARIALINEYSSKQHSFAINGLTFIIAFFTFLQIRGIIHSIYTYIFAPLLSSLIILCFLRYLFYEYATSYAKTSEPKSETKNNKFYLSRLDKGVKDKIKDDKHSKFVYPFGEIKFWIPLFIVIPILLGLLIYLLTHCSCGR